MAATNTSSCCGPGENVTMWPSEQGDGDVQQWFWVDRNDRRLRQSRYLFWGHHLIDAHFEKKCLSWIFLFRKKCFNYFIWISNLFLCKIKWAQFNFPAESLLVMWDIENIREYFE